MPRKSAAQAFADVVREAYNDTPAFPLQPSGPSMGEVDRLLDAIIDELFNDTEPSPLLGGFGSGGGGANDRFVVDGDGHYAYTAPQLVNNPCWEPVGCVVSDPGLSPPGPCWSGGSTSDVIWRSIPGLIAPPSWIDDCGRGYGGLSCVSPAVLAADFNSAHPFAYSEAFAAGTIQGAGCSHLCGGDGNPAWDHIALAGYWRVCPTSDPPVTTVPGGLASEEMPDANEVRRYRPAKRTPDDQRRERERRRPRDWDFTMLEFWIGPPLPPLSGIQPRQPPKDNVREGKGRNKIQKVFKALDRISESAEVVNGIFEALPCDIQKAAMKKCRKKQAFLDNAGQYGIDQVDCKAAAIWDHYDKIDVPLAVSNIIRNEVEDRTYGALYKRLPRNVGNAPMTWEGYNRAVNHDGNFENDRFFNPLNDLVNMVVMRVSEGLGLEPPREC